jgi:PAS domain S-box-containing protein
MELSGTLARSILDAAPVSIVIVTAAGTIAFANTRVTEIFGYAPDEILGREVECLLPQRIRNKHPAHRRRFVDRPKVRPMGAGLELYGLHKDGREFPVEISLAFRGRSRVAYSTSSIRSIAARRARKA